MFILSTYDVIIEIYECMKRVELSLQSLRSSSLFGESLRTIPRSSLKVSKSKKSTFVTKCEIGDSLVSVSVPLHVS